MSNPNPNDMAFPVDPEHTPNNSIQCGLTKREYLAGLAMQGVINHVLSKGYSHDTAHSIAADRAVAFADALLTALSK